MWCDDFDMDLLKVIPDAGKLLESVGNVTLYTYGHSTDGKLNHPSVWSSYNSMVALFGFESPDKPDHYVTWDPVVKCTFEEAIRDCWCHRYAIVVGGRHIWNTDTPFMIQDFDIIMGHVRGYAADETEFRQAQERVRDSLVRAVNELQALRAFHP